MQAENSEPLLELQGICKRFPGVYALKNVDLVIYPGRVLALVGENGAGKSTLMKIIDGIYQPDAGKIVLRGEKTVIRHPMDARKKGIAMIHQELNYFPELSVEENMFMGQHPERYKAFVNWGEIRRRVAALCQQEGLPYSPQMKIKELTVSQIQMLEILKAVSVDSKIIIMDEPTSSIGDKEVASLFSKIRALREQGIGIVYISHKLDEIFQIADDVVVLRDGCRISQGSVSEYTPESLIADMVGRRMENIYAKETVPTGEVALELRRLTRKGRFHDVSLKAHKGEIVGMAGLVGAGRTELARSIAGLDSQDSGEVLLHGKTLSIQSVSDSIRTGIVMVSEDRKEYGIIPVRSIQENISLTMLRMSKGLFVKRQQETERVEKLAKELSIKAPSLLSPIMTLSGGNQQKAILARWLLLLHSDVFILDEPTRGVDVGAKFEIYKIITELAKQGKAIILISSELPELIGMSDRIYVMSGGRITGEFSRDSFSQETILKRAVKS